MPTRPRIGLLVPRFTVFDGVLGPARVERLRERGGVLRDALAEHADVVYPGPVETAEDAGRARAAFDGERVEAVVVAPAMAAPPSLSLAVLVGDTPPAVLWNPIGIGRLPDGASQADATEHTSTVGSQMLAGALARVGRAAPVVTTGPAGGAPLDVLRRTISAAAAAGALRGTVLVRIGDPAPGYLNIEAGDDELARLGIRVVPIPKDELDDAFASVEPEEVATVLDEVALSGLRAEPGPTADRSGRLACAVGRLLDRHGAAGGSVSCMGPLLRFSEEIGIVACLAVARETARGRPLSCTADVPAAIAMQLARRLGGAALYGEWYVSEEATDRALFLGGGEADPAWAEPGAPIAVRETTSFPGARGLGLGLHFTPRRGPATLVGVGAAADGWRLAWGTAEVTGSRSDELRGPNALLRLDGVDALSAASGLIATGVTHHPILVPGRLDVEMPVVAACLGADERRFTA